MAQRFPIFIDLGNVAPLVVGADQGLAAKIRLLAGFAPVVDLVTGMDLPPGELRHPQMHHLREIVGYCHRLLASGHLIPNQADYLRRCGFTHVEIDMRNEKQWRRSLALSPPPMQRVLATPASRDATP